MYYKYEWLEKNYKIKRYNKNQDGIRIEKSGDVKFCHYKKGIEKNIIIFQ